MHDKNHGGKETMGNFKNNMENRVGGNTSCRDLDVGAVENISLVSTTGTINTNENIRQVLPDHQRMNSMLTYEEGLFQAIGFKEFHSYITNTEDDLEKRETLFRDGLEKN